MWQKSAYRKCGLTMAGIKHEFNAPVTEAAQSGNIHCLQH